MHALRQHRRGTARRRRAAGMLRRGNETDETTYKQQCEMVIEVPNTGSSDNLVFTVLGIVTITGAVLVIKKF